MNVLKEARKFDGVAATFQQARSAIGDDADTVATYGGLAHDVVAFTPTSRATRAAGCSPKPRRSQPRPSNALTAMARAC